MSFSLCTFLVVILQCDALLPSNNMTQNIRRKAGVVRTHTETGHGVRPPSFAWLLCVGPVPSPHLTSVYVSVKQACEGVKGEKQRDLHVECWPSALHMLVLEKVKVVIDGGHSAGGEERPLGDTPRRAHV